MLDKKQSKPSKRREAEKPKKKFKFDLDVDPQNFTTELDESNNEYQITITVEE